MPSELDLSTASPTCRLVAVAYDAEPALGGTPGQSCCRGVLGHRSFCAPAEQITDSASRVDARYGPISAVRLAWRGFPRRSGEVSDYAGAA